MCTCAFNSPEDRRFTPNKFVGPTSGLNQNESYLKKSLNQIQFRLTVFVIVFETAFDVFSRRWVTVINSIKQI